MIKWIKLAHISKARNTLEIKLITCKFKRTPSEFQTNNLQFKWRGSEDAFSCQRTPHTECQTLNEGA